MLRALSASSSRAHYFVLGKPQIVSIYFRLPFTACVRETVKNIYDEQMSYLKCKAILENTITVNYGQGVHNYTASYINYYGDRMLYSKINWENSFWLNSVKKKKIP